MNQKTKLPVIITCLVIIVIGAITVILLSITEREESVIETGKITSLALKHLLDEVFSKLSIKL